MLVCELDEIYDQFFNCSINNLSFCFVSVTLRLLDWTSISVDVIFPVVEETKRAG